MNKLLVVVDMQKDFIDGSLGTPEAQAIVPAVVEKIKSFDGDVVYTMDTHDENYLETQEGRKLPVVHCVVNTDGWELHPDVQAALNEKHANVITKSTFGAVDLIEYIERDCRGKEYGSIELVGLCTDICVVSNAMLLKAWYPETPISVYASCCAGVTPESHKAALTTMKMCQIEVK
jgi:nicotinamidase-related amidase